MNTETIAYPQNEILATSLALAGRTVEQLLARIQHPAYQGREFPISGDILSQCTK